MKTIRRMRRLYAAAMVALMSLVFLPQQSFSLPEGGTVQAGTASIPDPIDGVLNINQMSQQAIIEWIRFCIASGETVNFNQPGPHAIALNRVTGGSISEIFGALNAFKSRAIADPLILSIPPTVYAASALYTL